MQEPTRIASQETVSVADVRDARIRIQSHVYKTPFYRNQYLSKFFGSDVFLKMECYQVTGVFKIRGAFNFLLKDLDRSRQNGVVTASSGNHGLSVAYASRALDVDCKVVVTQGANPDKVKMIKLNGAQVLEGGPTSDSIIAKAEEIARESGRLFVHPFADPAVIAGQGTCGLEMLDQVPDLDTIIVPVGGGGLISGIATVFKEENPTCKVIGVQAAGVPSLYEALKQGHLVTIKDPHTIADGLLGQTIGKTDFAICKQNVDEVLLVSDESMRSAVKSLLFEAHILAEPSGAAPVATLLTGAYKPRKRGEKIGLVISGGNIAYTLLQDLLNETYPSRVRKNAE